MNNQPLNLKTSTSLSLYLASPGQSVGLIGQKWLNKTLLAQNLAEELLQIPKGSLTSYPYYSLVKPEELVSITIDQVREINRFITLKVPSNKSINRVLIISPADKLSLDAQNALLKNLEEPPVGTVFILIAESLSSLLPTITSRLSIINIYKPSKDDLLNYYKNQGYEDSDINQALLIADGLPGLVDQLLSSKDSPISEATTLARKLLSSSTFDRLNLVNDLSKNKEELRNTLFVIKQMAKIGVASNETKNALRWQKVLSATLDSETKLRSNVQVKLLLTDYMLSLG